MPVVLLMLALLAAPATAIGPADGAVDLHFFWSELCPHCRDARPFVESLAREYPWLRLHSHELSRSAENRRLYLEMAAALGQEARSVPAFVFCGRMLVGFDAEATTGAWLRGRLLACRAGSGDDAPALAVANAPQRRALWLSTLVIAATGAASWWWADSSC